MTLGKKIASGLGMVLIIMIILGGMAIYNMKIAENNSVNLDKKYVPEVEIAGQIERNFSKVRIEAAKFIFTENDKYFKNSEKYFQETYSGIQRAKDLSREYPELVTLKKVVATVDSKIHLYQKGISGINDIFTNKDVIRKNLDKNALIFMNSINKYTSGQERKLKNDFKNKASLEKISQRLKKISIAQKIKAFGDDLRIANFKSDARNSITILTDGVEAFEEVENEYKKLKAMTTKQSDINLINDMQKSGENYKKGLKNLEQASLKINTYLVDLTKIGVEALKGVENIYEASISGTTKLSTESSNTLQSAVQTMIIGLIIAIIIGLLLAFFITKNITTTIIQAVKSIIEANNQVVSASNEIADSSTSLAEGASEQASSVEQVSATIEESTSINTQNAGNSREADVLARETKEAAEQGFSKGNELMIAMKEINQSSERISKIIKTIDEIASQTKLLALNAAVEAARAGEHGLGFAVVADEVKALAQRSADAATETAGIIEDSINQAKNGSEISEQTSEAFNNILEKIKKTSNIIGEISISAKEQSEGMNQISSAMGEIDQITQQNAATSEEAAAASEELNAQAVSMKETVGEIAKMVGYNHEEAHTTKEKEHKKIEKPKQKITHKPLQKKTTQTNDVFPLDEDDLKEF